MKKFLKICTILLIAYFVLNLFLWLLPFILIFVVLRIVISLFSTNKKSQKRTYYYKYGDNNAQDFNDFFRRAGYGGQYQQGQSYNGYGNNTYFEDKNKYYNALGISEGATQEEIKKAYRNKAREYHPDKHAQSSENVKIEAEKKFKEINEAYEKLKDN